MTTETNIQTFTEREAKDARRSYIIGGHDHGRHAFRVNGIIRRCEGYVELECMDWRETGWTGR